MRWNRLLRTPPPDTGWALDDAVAVAVHRRRKGAPLCAEEALPEGAVEIGPVGLQAVHGDRLTPVLASLHGRIEGARRATVVVPMRWVRAHILELDDPPRRRSELEEVVRWRLKKLLPVRPEELRLDLVSCGRVDQRSRMLCLTGLDRAFGALEEAFAEAGVQPALVTPAPFALAAAFDGDPRPGLVVALEPGMLAVLLVAEGTTSLLRTKPLPASDEMWRIVNRELRLTMVFIREQLKVEGEIGVRVLTRGGLPPEPLEAWRDEDPSLAPAAVEESLACSGELANATLVAPLAALLNGRRP